MKLFLNKTSGCFLLLIVALCLQLKITAQSATISYPFAVGTTSSCGGSTGQIHFYTYNGTANSIASITSNVPTDPVGRYTPQLRIGTTNTSGQRFTSSAASISYNPQDKNIYYLWTAYASNNAAITQGSAARTFVWRWPVGTKPTATSPRLDTIRSFGADLLGVAFDANGNGYIIEFTDSLPTVPVKTFKPLIRSINFTTGALGAADTLAITGGAKIYQPGSGDLAMSPSGQMFFVLDNKLFTPNYTSYTGTGQNLTCTYVDTVVNAATGYFVGLTYAEGETVSAYYGGGCPFFETDPLTAATTAITGIVYSASDMATVISGIGASKNLLSVTPTGIANQYNVVYEVYAKNYGNTDITNFQITDSLGLINGNANVSNVSIAFATGGNPAGLVLNTGYTGTGALASNHNLLTGTGILPNYPASNNFVKIRVSCRLSGIQNGVVYNNSAIAKGIGFNSQALRDSSANGDAPDLNTNDKPDDLGESEPTPLLIAITPQTPPCATLGQVFYRQDFGTGANIAALPAAPSGRTTYTGSTTQPLATDRFMIASNANAGDNSRFISLVDHTTGAGRMLVVNADAVHNVFYSDTVTALCGGQQYSLSFYAAFIGNSSYQTVCNGFGGFKYPKVKMRIKDVSTGLVITEISTTDIFLTSWNQYGMKWVMPAGYSNVIFELINDGQGGCGNDIAIDDIEFGICDAAPVVSVTGNSTGCIGSTTDMTAILNDPSAVPGARQYQWQVSTDNLVFTDVAGATAATYTISNLSAADVNKYYRVLIAANGNITSPNCRYAAPGYLLTAKLTSVAPTATAANKTASCPGDATLLRVSGGTLGTNANYRWYAGSCGGTSIGSGSAISVNPSVTTTYYVRIQGDCNITSCIPVTVVINCDIDADDDGLPDVLESNNTDPKLDDDFDGVLNYRDADYAGFIDSNGDLVNDNFDWDKDGVPNYLDKDSDNDGVPDVVESEGGDSNGDGRLDGFADSDADGFSDNVDANLSAHTTSGNGLGLLDLDGDGVPNYFDLDSDADGIPDVVEAYGTDANNNGMIDGFADSDGDGFSNSVDGDANGDGVVENTTGPLLRTGTVLSNGRAGSYPNKNIDGDLKANLHDLDSDGDGLTDVVEAQFADADANGKIDGSMNARGWSTTVSASVPLALPNADGSGRANVYDIDSDDDGIPDGVEGLSTSAYLMPAAADADADGIDDTYDNFSGFGGRGIIPFNKDGDALPDYLDSDSDGDGLQDRVEGNDFNLNRQPDDDVALTGLDTDGDGLDNKFDSDNTSAKGASQYMGNGGTFTGPSSPGSRAMVQKSMPAFTDRDWRQVEYVLNLDFLSFTASWPTEKVVLNWTVFCQAEVEHYIVERSTDGLAFIPVAVVNSSKKINEKETYQTYDVVNNAVNATYYYRIKAVQKSGKYKYSSIAVAAKEKTETQSVKVLQNPVQGSLQLGITATENTQGRFLIYDAKGGLVLSIQEPVFKGYATYRYPAVTKLSNGQYYVRIYMHDQWLSVPFIVQH